MKLYPILMAVVCGVSFSASAQLYDFNRSAARMERELNYICSTSIGAIIGSSEYLACRASYRDLLLDYQYDFDHIYPYQITAFLERTRPMITRCRSLGIGAAFVWGCLEKEERDYFDRWKHKHLPAKDFHRPQKPDFRPAPNGHHRPHEFRPEPPRPDFRPNRPEPPKHHGGKPHSGKR